MIKDDNDNMSRVARADSEVLSVGGQDDHFWGRAPPRLLIGFSAALPRGPRGFTTNKGGNRQIHLLFRETIARCVIAVRRMGEGLITQNSDIGA